MFPRIDPPPALLAIADQQDGVLRHDQVLEHLGRTPLRRMLSRGEVTRITPGIYLLATNTPTVEQRGRAGILLGGDGVALGGRAALHLAGLERAPDDIDVWVPPGRRIKDRPGWTFRQDGCGRLAQTLGSLPRIRLEEALIDVGSGCDVEEWVTLLAEATRVGKVAVPEVVRRLEGRYRLPQRRMLREVALDLQGIESTLEWVYRRDVERAHGLPEGQRQVRTAGHWKCDVRYPPLRTDARPFIVEIDGRLHLKRVFRDLERDNDHALRDEATVRYGSVDLRGRPCRVAWQVGGALFRRGHPLPVPCPRCPGPGSTRRWAGLDA